AGAVSHGEQLLGVSTSARSALFLRGAQFDINHAIISGSPALSATGNFCFGGVGNVFGCLHARAPFVEAELLQFRCRIDGNPPSTLVDGEEQCLGTSTR